MKRHIKQNMYRRIDRYQDVSHLSLPENLYAKMYIGLLSNISYVVQWKARRCTMENKS